MIEAAAVGFTGILKGEALAELIREGDSATLEAARTHGQGSTRRCAVAGLPAWTKTCWDIMAQINAAHFGFDIQGIETPQYMIYREGDQFGFHMDKGEGTERPRKLSLTIQLSRSDEYDGGDLECFVGDGMMSAKRDPGAGLAFPSWIVHQVTPVTRGERRSLVVWAWGAPFR